MMDKDTLEELKVFESISEAERFLGSRSHISAVCKGKRKTSNGYAWKYLNR